MTRMGVEDAHPVEATVDGIDDRQAEEEPVVEYMQGWALASLTLAFMSICFVLALDNTILGLPSPRSL